jgi:2-C-methyl-D-erythritol 4-phosphate cytidylyltransferase
MKTVAIIVAGGVGKRVGGDIPKQFLPLAGKPMIVHTLEAFERCPGVESTILVLPEERVDFFMKELRPRHPTPKLEKVVRGGATRQGSTRAGFENLPKETEIVLVHDGARPLVSVESIEQCIEAARKEGAALLARPASDTIKESDGEGFVLRTHDRRRIYRAETPQAFRTEVLAKALRWAEENGFDGTDEAGLVERMGGRVKIVESRSPNLKLTTAEDFAVAEALLKKEERR